jgi:formate-dependent nitrite reductase membrane component NrfD
MATVARHDQLLADLGATFRPQRHWVEGRGALLILGHFLSGVGAGTWLFSLWLGYRPGLALAVGAMAASGVAHLFFLGHPERFWRMLHVRASWIARGFAGMALFMAGGVVTLLLTPGVVRSLAVVVSVAGAAIVIVYKGNVYAASRGVPFWNSPALPVLYATYAIRGGLAVLLVMLPLSTPVASVPLMALIELWVAVSAAVMLGLYLGVMRHSSPAARRSVAELTGGRAALGFYVGTVGAGLVVPIAVGMVGLAGPVPRLALAATGLLSLAGDFFAKYAIAKAGIYVPLVPAGRG